MQVEEEDDKIIKYFLYLIQHQGEEGGSGFPSLCDLFL